MNILTAVKSGVSIRRLCHPYFGSISNQFNGRGYSLRFREKEKYIIVEGKPVSIQSEVHRQTDFPLNYDDLMATDWVVDNIQLSGWKCLKYGTFNVITYLLQLIKNKT